MHRGESVNFEVLKLSHIPEIKKTKQKKKLGHGQGEHRVQMKTRDTRRVIDPLFCVSSLKGGGVDFQLQG